MTEIPWRIRLDQRYPAAVALGGVAAFVATAVVPEDYALGAVILGVCALLGAAYMVSLDVATFTQDSVKIGRREYPLAEIGSVETRARDVTMMTRSFRTYTVRQSSLMLYPPDGGAPRHIDIMNARGGAEAVAEVLRAHLDRVRADANG